MNMFTSPPIACTKFRTIQVFVVYAGTEHEHFIQHFPYWIVNKEVQLLNCKVSGPSNNIIVLVGAIKHV